MQSLCYYLHLIITKSLNYIKSFLLVSVPVACFVPYVKEFHLTGFNSYFDSFRSG